jgi:cation:H+ antiporter
MTQQDGLKIQVHWMLAVTIGFILLCFFGELSLPAGIGMVLILALFLFLSVTGSVPFAALNELTQNQEASPAHKGSYWRIAGLIGLGMVALPVGADFVVTAGTSLALNLGVSESVIGASLVALGTSLPELSATLVAAYYRNSDVALGNVVGSNLFNILAVLGVTLMFADIPIDPVFLKFDIWVMLSAAVVLWLFALFGAKIGRLAGIAFLCGYGGYIWSLFSG